MKKFWIAVFTCLFLCASFWAGTHDAHAQECGTMKSSGRRLYLETRQEIWSRHYQAVNAMKQVNQLLTAKQRHLISQYADGFGSDQEIREMVQPWVSRANRGEKRIELTSSFYNNQVIAAEAFPEGDYAIHMTFKRNAADELKELDTSTEELLERALSSRLCIQAKSGEEQTSDHCKLYRSEKQFQLEHERIPEFCFGKKK